MAPRGQRITRARRASSPSWTSISSSGTPLVSGITFSTQTSWPIIATKKMLNAAPRPNAPMIGGNANEVIAANTQWVRLPSDWPRPRIRFGKISEMNTQITDPWPNACAAMNTISPISTSTAEVVLYLPRAYCRTSRRPGSPG